MDKKHERHARRFSRRDPDQDENDENGDGDGESRIERAMAKLSSSIEGIRTTERDDLMGVLEKFAEKLDTTRSRKPPIGKKADGDDDQSRETKREKRGPKGGDVLDCREFRTLGDGRDQLYRRMERDPVHARSIPEISEFRAARNPVMDALSQRWAEAIWANDGGEQRRVAEEMNGRYVEALGFSRAILLEGAADADSGFADGTGAELLPLPLAGQLVMERDAAAVMRGLANVFPMATQTQRVPVMPTATAATRAENASYSDTTPDPDSALLTAHDLGVSFSAGRNFLEDSAFNIANVLTVVAGQAIGAEEDSQICTSTASGSDITEGLDAATIIDIAETTSGTLGYVDVVALHYGVPKPYRRNSAYFAAGTSLVDVMNIVDGNGRPMFIPPTEAPRGIGNESGFVGFIMGKPIYEVPVADDVLYHGDPQWYAFGNRSGIRVDTERAVATGARTWVIDERVDGRVIPTSAVGTNLAWRKIVY